MNQWTWNEHGMSRTSSQSSRNRRITFSAKIQSMRRIQHDSAGPSRALTLACSKRFPNKKGMYVCTTFDPQSAQSLANTKKAMQSVGVDCNFSQGTSLRCVFPTFQDFRSSRIFCLETKSWPLAAACWPLPSDSK